MMFYVSLEINSVRLVRQKCSFVAALVLLVVQMNTSPPRVVITGIGVVSPLGSTPEALWEGLLTKQSAVRPLLAPPGALASEGQIASGGAEEQVVGGDGFPVRFGAEARQFVNDEIECFGPLEKERKKAIRKGVKLMCRECQMGVAAAQLALADARLEPGAVDPQRIGVSFGVDYMLSIPHEFIEGIRGCLDSAGDFHFSQWGSVGLSKMSPLWLLKYLPNMPASHVAIYNDLRGPNNSLTMREAAANIALTEAFQIILRGGAELMLVGATGTRLHPMKTIHAIQQEELADPTCEPARASRPFDRQRTGMVLGEGAGAVLLETLASATARNARLYGEVIAGASSIAVGPRLLAQRERAIRNVLSAVLGQSSTAPEQIGHLHAHGLSTRRSDCEEAQAIAAVFGGRKAPLPVVAAKGHFGNLGAGGGMVELIASLLAMEHDRLFPTLNYETPDPECPIHVVTNGSTPAGESFVNLNVTPQGQASAVLVRRCR